MTHKWARTHVTGACSGQPVAVPPAADLRLWLAAQGKQHGLRWLLAHADNGIIWGELRDSVLKLSSDVFGPDELRLDLATLQQARLFGEGGELRLWQGPGGLMAHLLLDGAGDPVEWCDEQYLLWGWATPSSETRDGFIELVEGRQGIRHAPPLSVAPSEERRASLLVRHYLAENADGVTRIVESRLVKVD